MVASELHQDELHKAISLQYINHQYNNADKQAMRLIMPVTNALPDQAPTFNSTNLLISSGC